METNQALSIIKQACASINASLAVHQQIQAAIGVIEKELANEPKTNPLPSDSE